MKNELGIRICCENCKYYNPIKCIHFDACIDNLTYFRSSYLILQSRIRELQEQQFTKVEAGTVLFYMKQANLIMKNENEHIPNIESIFSKLEKMKGEQ